ncbi:MAG: hypothetical protein KJI72_03250 [Patescibacteria group bacterium]|nr:hypothetical protein [Patescibacteria group bacterium]
MAEINVNGNKSSSGDLFVFDIEVVENDTKTAHTVEVGKSYYEKLTSGKITPEELVRKSFEFLLKREPKESILKEFNITKISYYFPEYEEEIANSISLKYEEEKS